MTQWPRKGRRFLLLPLRFLKKRNNQKSEDKVKIIFIVVNRLHIDCLFKRRVLSKVSRLSRFVNWYLHVRTHTRVWGHGLKSIFDLFQVNRGLITICSNSCVKDSKQSKPGRARRKSAMIQYYWKPFKCSKVPRSYH